MVTNLFIVVQVGINVVLLVAFFLLLRERRVAAQMARAREERLEALAEELCALGQHIVTEGQTQMASADGPQNGGAFRSGSAPGQPGNQATGRSGNSAIGHVGNLAPGEIENSAARQSASPVVGLPSRQVAELPSCQVAGSPECQVAKLPSCQTAELPSCQVAKSPDCQIAQDPEPSDRLKTAAALLDRGLSVTAVASRTEIPDGEVQLLKNLRRVRSSAHRSTSPRRHEA
jgi:hypothetical protein